jgi:hypothetical protein
MVNGTLTWHGQRPVRRRDSRRNAASPVIDVAQNQAASYKCGWDKFAGINPRVPWDNQRDSRDDQAIAFGDNGACASRRAGPVTAKNGQNRLYFQL